MQTLTCIIEGPTALSQKTWSNLCQEVLFTAKSYDTLFSGLSSASEPHRRLCVVIRHESTTLLQDFSIKIQALLKAYSGPSVTWSQGEEYF